MDEYGVITTGSAWDDFIIDKYASQIVEALSVMSDGLTMIELQMLIEGDVKQVKSAIYGLIERVYVRPKKDPEEKRHSF